MTPFKLKVNVTNEHGELLEQQTFFVPGTSEGRASQELIDYLERKFEFINDLDLEEEEDEYDGQPDWAQEWHDFDPDC